MNLEKTTSGSVIKMSALNSTVISAATTDGA